MYKREELQRKQFFQFISFTGVSHYSILFVCFGCVKSSLLHTCFLYLWQVGATLRCGTRVSHCSGFSCCGAQALGTWASVVVARGLQSAGSVVVAHGLSCSEATSQTRDRTCVPCIGRRILNHYATGEVPLISLCLHGRESRGLC